MGKCLITSVNPEAILLENILIYFEGQTFSKSQAAAIVGGEKRLEMLIASGEVEAEKETLSQNGKWFCNAAQVLKHIRNMRTKKQKNQKLNQ